MNLNRRQLLKLLVSGVAGSVIDTDQLLWVPNRSRIYVPHPAQIEFFNRPDYATFLGVPYHMSNGSTGTWLGLQRSTTPLDWKKLLDRLTINPKEGLYVINEGTVGGNVGDGEKDRGKCQTPEIATHKTKHSV